MARRSLVSFASRLLAWISSAAALFACAAPAPTCPCNEPQSSSPAAAPSSECARDDAGASRPAGSPAVALAAAPAQAGPVDWDAVSARTNAALYRSKDGDGAGCLRELDAVDRMDPKHAASRWLTRSICELQAGKCVEGRARFRKGLDDAPTQRHMKPEELDTATESMASQHCPPAELLPRERALRDLTALRDASAAKDGAFCASEGLALIPLIDALPRRGEADERSRMVAVSDLHLAAECAAANGRCADARTVIHAWWARLPTASPLSSAQIDADFDRQHPTCKQGATAP